MARLEDVSRSAGIANDYYHCFRDYLVATLVQAPNRTRKNALSVIVVISDLFSITLECIRFSVFAILRIIYKLKIGLNFQKNGDCKL
jgi:hypothetical protein